MQIYESPDKEFKITVKDAQWDKKEHNYDIRKMMHEQNKNIKEEKP